MQQNLLLLYRKIQLQYGGDIYISLKRNNLQSVYGLKLLCGSIANDWKYICMPPSKKVEVIYIPAYLSVCKIHRSQTLGQSIAEECLVPNTSSLVH